MCKLTKSKTASSGQTMASYETNFYLSKHFMFHTTNHLMGKNSKRTSNDQRSDVRQTHENNNAERQAMLDNRSIQMNRK